MHQLLCKYRQIALKSCYSDAGGNLSPPYLFNGLYHEHNVLNRLQKVAGILYL